MAAIQRATAAIIADLRRQAEATGCEVDDNGASAQVDGSFEVEPLVRAVLLAIREPSEAMINAAWELDKLGPDVIDVPYQGLPEDIWPAMIDAALAEAL